MMKIEFLPSLLTIFLAIVTKKPKSSIFVGILACASIYTHSQGGGALEAMEYLWGHCLLPILKTPLKWVVFSYIILFGILIEFLSFGHGAYVLGQKFIRNPKELHLYAFFVGILLFFDDYFSALALGLIFARPFDLFKIPRERLSFLIDATASSVCVLAPFSTWVAFLLSFLEVDITFYWKTIPYNFYCWGIVLYAFYYAWNSRQENQRMEDISSPSPSLPKQYSIRSFTYPLIILIGLLVFFLIIPLSIPMPVSLLLSVLSSLLCSFLFLRKDMHGPFFYSEIRKKSYHGGKMMVGTIILLILSWMYGTCMKDLQVAKIVSEYVLHHLSPVLILPLLFLLSSIMSFATGSAYGTYSIMLPIGLGLANQENMALVVSSILGGGVFGDHASPVSDTTVLSAASAQIPLMRHVSNQLPIALLVALGTFILYTLMGFLYFT